MQGDASGSGPSKRQGDQSSAKESAGSRSVDTRKTLLTEAEYQTRSYLEYRLTELRVRKTEMQNEISFLYTKQIGNLMKDADDLKIIVQNGVHDSVSRQHCFDACLKFQDELQQPWHISLAEQQECSSATKKLKVAYLHEAKAVPSRDQYDYTRPCQAAGVIPVESVEAHGHVQALTEKSTIKVFDPLINSQGLQTSSWKECQNPDGATSNTRQELDSHIYAGRNQSQQASNAKENIVRVQAGKTQEEAIRDNVYTQGEASRSDDTAIINSQQTLRTTADAHVAASKASTRRADTATGRAASDAGVDTTSAGYSQRPLNETDLPTGVDQSCIDLLLIGKCGNGKSATGNSILRRPAFRRTASSSVASASSIKMESTEFSGKVVNVIDGPSISVSGNITPEEVGNIIENVNKSLELCKFSFTALLIILKFGERFTKQEIEALRVIKAVLGKDVVREYGVCVITYGDGFEYAKEEARESGEEMTFEGWLKEQTGEVTNLFKECNNRCVLFDNVTKDDGKRQSQLDKLMDILPKGKRYSKDAFLQATQGTQDLEMEASLPTFLKEAQAEADKIRELIDRHEEIKKYDPEANNIKLKLRELKEKINTMRIRSVELESLKMSIDVLESNLIMKLQRWQLERDIKMKRGAQGKTSARSPTPAQADQTTMTMYKTPYDSPGTGLNRDMAEPLHFDRDISAPSDFNMGMCAPSYSNRDMAAPSGLATSINKTSSSVDNHRHTFTNNTGSIQGLPVNNNPTPATLPIHETGITDQHSDPYVVVDKERVSGEGNAADLFIIKTRIMDAYTSS